MERSHLRLKWSAQSGSSVSGPSCFRYRIPGLIHDRRYTCVNDNNSELDTTLSEWVFKPSKRLST